MSGNAKRLMKEVDGKEYFFSFAKFGRTYEEYYRERKQQDRKYSKQKLRDKLADSVGLSAEAVKQWVNRHNGPADIDTVEKIADFFGVECMELLACNEGEATMIQDTKVTMDFSSSEREAVLKTYEMAVDFAYFVADRYKNALTDPILEDNREFFMRCRSRLNTIYRHIDNNGLLLSEESRKKLYRIVGELSQCQSPVEESLGRWRRLNPNYYEAWFLCNDPDDDETENAQKLQDDVFGEFEPQYWATTAEERIYMTGYHKDTTTEEVTRAMEKSSSYDTERLVLIPAHSNATVYNDFDELYRFEFVKTIIAVFKEDFPDYFVK